MKQLVGTAAFAAVTVLGTSTARASLTIPTVLIGNPGNAPDPLTGSLYGSVTYSYNIGATEVTNAQYAAFLNAVASDDTNSLYNASMAGPFGGITRWGSAGTYTYAPVGGRENNPVTYVSFWDATRFANWLHNGQPIGAQAASTTEDGAYTLTPSGIMANTITRNSGWQWAVPSESEWYKAAYHQPASQGGPSSNYWLYPTSNDADPTSGQANFAGMIGNTTPVGSYSANFYGVFDMSGNVWELNDAVLYGSSRGMRGGSMFSPGSFMRADDRNSTNAANEGADDGFRVVQVPGPSSIPLLAIGVLGALRRGWDAGRSRIW